MTFELLKNAGFTVAVADGPEQALQLSMGNSFDILLSDVIMPVMTGPELHAQLNQSNPEMKVLFMSGYSENVISKNGISDVSVCFIQKPFTLNELMNKIEDVLNN